MPLLKPLQSHGSALVYSIDQEEVVAYANNLASFLGGAAGVAIGQSVAEVIGAENCQQLRQQREAQNQRPLTLGRCRLIPFFLEEQIVLEIESLPASDPSLDYALGLEELAKTTGTAEDIDDLLERVCTSFYEHLPFERVIFYQLEEGGTGLVRAECGVGELPSLLGVHFRERDFPEEAIRMHQKESVYNHTSSDVARPTVIGHPDEAASEVINYHLSCRSSYPTLPQFLQSAGIATQLSVALTVDNRIWGVLFAHHRQPITPDFTTHSFARLAGVLIERKLTTLITSLAQSKRMAANHSRTRIRESIASASDPVKGLIEGRFTLIDLIDDTKGAAISFDNELNLLGDCPSKEQVKDLIKWVRENHLREEEEVYFTTHLQGVYPPAADFIKTAAGLLFLPLDSSGRDCILWFRPENRRTIKYGSLADAKGSVQRFTPTEEIRQGHSKEWSSFHLKIAKDLQLYLRDVVMQRYAELREVNRRLKEAYDELESFSYTVSHDLRAPLRGIDGFAEIFLEDYGNEISEDGRALILTIQNSAARMNQFISDILELSRIGRAQLTINEISVPQLVGEIKRDVPDLRMDRIGIEVQPDIPPIRGDKRQLKTVYSNLILNAIKYSSKEPQIFISIGYEPHTGDEGGEFFVRDNGIGIAPEHQQRIFGMFNRLVSEREYEGSGVGLALVRRIINRHRGTIRVESRVGEGATFLFKTGV